MGCKKQHFGFSMKVEDYQFIVFNNNIYGRDVRFSVHLLNYDELFFRAKDRYLLKTNSKVRYLCSLIGNVVLYDDILHLDHKII